MLIIRYLSQNKVLSPCFARKFHSEKCIFINVAQAGRLCYIIKQAEKNNNIVFSEHLP